MAGDRFLPRYDGWRGAMPPWGQRRCPPGPGWPRMPGYEHCFEHGVDTTLRPPPKVVSADPEEGESKGGAPCVDWLVVLIAGNLGGTLRLEVDVSATEYVGGDNPYAPYMGLYAGNLVIQIRVVPEIGSTPSLLLVTLPTGSQSLVPVPYVDCQDKMGGSLVSGCLSHPAYNKAPDPAVLIGAKVGTKKIHGGPVDALAVKIHPSTTAKVETDTGVLTAPHMGKFLRIIGANPFTASYPSHFDLAYFVKVCG